MEILLIGGAAFVIVMAWRLLNSGSNKPANQPRTRSAQPQNHNPYQSLSLMLPIAHCDAASSLADKRFLKREAPSLPLQGCNKATCKCGFVKHTDRRDDEGDRRALYGLRAEMHAIHTGNERRKRRGRRTGDFAMA
ncbi:hypothetical protein [Marinobacter alexandrii]|uniref:hypothetical protein n=1 Tax=Marinobacter alexandrii TaxID=2570351 RepID=UPI003296F8EB